MIDRLVLLLLIAGSALFGAILLIEFGPTGADHAATAEVASRPETAPASRRQPSPRIEELVATILARPLFSSTRRPPPNAPAGMSADGDLTDTRLTGIVTGPGRRIAIFAVNGDKPLRVAEGEAVSGWRIESITPREILLSGPSGTKTLQPKLDPNLAQTAQPVVGNPTGRIPTPSAAAAGRVPIPPHAALPINASGVPRPPRQRPQR